MNCRLPLTANTWPNLSRYANGLFSGVIIAGGLTLLVALRLGWIDILPQSSEAANAEPSQPAATPTEVSLPPDKLAAARLRFASVEWQSIQPTRTVPGTLAYDAAKRVPVQAPVAGVITQVLVEPSQQVSAQQSLAVLSSPDVGLARDEVLRHEADLFLTRKTQYWAEEVAKNVDDLLALLAQKPKLDEAEAALARRTLGDYREKIFAPYSKLVLAELLVGGTDSLEGTLSRRLIDERRSGREVAAAQFAAACETATFLRWAGARQGPGGRRAGRASPGRRAAEARKSARSTGRHDANFRPLATERTRARRADCRAGRRTTGGAGVARRGRRSAVYDRRHQCDVGLG